MLQYSVDFFFLKKKPQTQTPKQNQPKNPTKQQNPPHLNQEEVDLESGALTCAVLIFIPLHSSCASIPLLADEHNPPQPCSALRVA